MATSSRYEKFLGLSLLCLPVAFNLVFLHPELTIGQQPINDHVLHLAASTRVLETFETGENPLDAWLGDFSEGYPFWRSYAPLPHLITAAVAKPLSFLPGLDLRKVFLLLDYILLSMLPICFFALARGIGMGWIGAGAAGAFSIVISGAGQYGRFGIGYGAQVWRGSGLYSQLWGLAFALLALAVFARAVRRGKGVVWAGVLLACVCLSHMIVGYVALVSAAILTLTGFGDDPPPLPRRLFRAGVTVVVTAILIAFFVIPMWLDRGWINHSRWEDTWKWDSFGAAEILRAFANGSLLDDGRWPIFTLLLAAGGLILAWRWQRDRTGRVLLILSAFWLAMFFGRTTWGHLMQLAGVPGDMHIHRFQAGFEIFAVLVAAAVVETALRRASARSVYRLLATVVFAGVLAPMYAERASYLELDKQWGSENLEAYAAERADIESLLAHLTTLVGTNPGRVHAGQAANWGGEFRVGSTPVYALLAGRRLPNTSFLYHSMSAASDVMVLLNEQRLGDLELFGVRYVVAPQEWVPRPALVLLATYGRFRLYEVPAGGYFGLITVPYAFEGTAETFFEASRDWLSSPNRQFGQHIALYPGRAPEGVYRQVLHRWDAIPPPTPEGPPGRVLGESKNGEEYRAVVIARQQGYVLFRSSFHPGLRAEVDAQPVETVAVTPGFAAFPVAAGEHQVRVYYDPGWLKTALLVIGLAVSGLIGWASRRGLLSRLELVITRVNVDAIRRPWMEPLIALGRRQGMALLIVGALALLALRPCYRGLLMEGHDSTAYPPRVVEFHENVRSGVLFPIWAPDLGNGYGQPLFEFAPPVLYWLAELFYATGAGLADSIQFALLVLGFLAAFSMYAIGCRMGGRYAGLVMAAAFLFSPYFQMDLYVRGAFAEFAGMAVLPLAFLLIWLAADARGWRLVPLAALGVAMLVLCHNVMALLGLPVLALAGLAMAGSDRGKILRVAASLTGGLALSTWFWLPALLEKSYVHIDRIREGYLQYSAHFLYLSQLLHAPWGYGLSVPGPSDAMALTLGPLALILAAIGATVAMRTYRGDPVRRRVVGTISIIAIGSAFITTIFSRFLWDAIPLLQYLEFPWRALAVGAFGLAILAGLGTLALQADGKTPKVVTGGLVTLIVLLSLNRAQPSSFLPFDDEFYSPERIAQNGVNTTTMEEFEPVTVRVRPAYSDLDLEPVTCPQGLQIGAASTQMPDYLQFTVSSAEACVARWNIFAYPGWEVQVDGQSVEIRTEPFYGRMLFEVPEGEHRVTARLRGTKVRAAARSVSAAALLVLLCSAMAPLWRRQRKP